MRLPQATSIKVNNTLSDLPANRQGEDVLSPWNEDYIFGYIAGSVKPDKNHEWLFEGIYLLEIGIDTGFNPLGIRKQRSRNLLPVDFILTPL
jgi:hypothetical protein